MFSWGAGPQGCLGHGNLRDRYSPLMIDRPLRDVNVVHVACYENHSAVISGKVKVYVHKPHTYCMMSSLFINVIAL